MPTSNPHLVLLHTDNISADYFADFTETVRVDKLELQLRSRPAGAVFAGVEWLIPTAIVAYIAKPYFESFLKEMGKDHYGLIKEGLKKIYAKVAGVDAPKMSVVSSAGKSNKEQPYSMFFSVVVEGPQGNTFKLLIPRPISESQYEIAIGAFLDFTQRLYSNGMDEQFELALKAIPNHGKTLLVVYDVAAKHLKPIDPFAGHRR